MIQIKQGTKRYRDGSHFVYGLNRLNLSLSLPCFVGITGPSGCGKSTLLNILGGLDFLDEGQYVYRQMQIDRQSEQMTVIRNREIGMIFQDHNLLDYLSVKDNLLLPSLYRAEKIKKEQLEQLAEQLGISDCLKRHPSQLSGGQRQRAAIARILLYGKKLILADEPTGSLDTDNALRIMDLFDELYRQGTSIIMVSHDLSLMERCACHIRMEAGHVVD